MVKLLVLIHYNLLSMDHNKLIAASQSFNLEGPGIKVTNSATQLETIVSTIIGFLSVIAVLFFIFQIIFAGYAFISASGDEKKVEVARKKLTDSILGLTIVVIAFGAGAFLANILGLGNIFDLNSVINILKFQ